MSDQEEQEDELLALSSIYDEILKVIKEENLNGGEISASPHLPDDFQVLFHKTSEDDKLEEKKCRSVEGELHSIKYLPPVTMNFVLPKDYPSKRPPNFTLACKWLNRKQLTTLCHKLDSIWEENTGCVVLFMWTTFLQEELFDYLHLKSPLELAKVISKARKDSDFKLDYRAIQEVSNQDQLLPVLLEYNKQEKERQFERNSYTCKVCFCEKAGMHCICFDDCGHVYCKDCMRDYFNVQIQEGNVKGLECPEDKCESQAHPSQVKNLVSPELFSKYDRLLLQTSLDTMADVTYCPRTTCQSPVLMDRETTLASCPECQFVFCTLCKLVYHGLSPCRLKSEGMVKLREEYLAGNEETKRFLEKRYGKATIQQALEESFSNEWLQKFSKQCPSCGFHIQKIDGCNKMTCMKCRAYFCWLCNDSLSRANPYAHYNAKGTNCSGRLFEGVATDEWEEEDDEEIDWWLDDI